MPQTNGAWLLQPYLERFTHGDCIAVLAELSSARVYLVVTDPRGCLIANPAAHLAPSGQTSELIARSREKYASERSDVEMKIERWLTSRDSDPRRIRKGRIPFLSVRI